MAKIKLAELASVIRSKNAGPYELTFDIIFKTNDIFDQVKRKKLINKEIIMDLYSLPEERINDIIYFQPSKAVKITIGRTVSAGAVGDTDVYGAQQHMPLVNLEIDME